VTSHRMGLGRPGVGHARVLAAPLLATTVIAGCMPAAASLEGQAIDDLYGVFLAGGVVVAAIVWGLATWVLLRYRRRGREDLPAQTRGNNAIEAIWTLTPLVTVLGLFILTVGTLNTVTAADPQPARIQVTAFRWGWQAVYPDTGRTVVAVLGQPANLVMPVDEPIEIQLSAIDVNHAFFVPAFLFKKDAIPGRPTTFQIRIANPGSYPGACAEYCGIGHDAMPFVITAVRAADFQAWLRGGALPSAPAASSP
jgi:cytochrome c oxidase subunit 2